MSKKLLLIDGHSILNRAFYGVPPLTNSKGQHTNGVYGFLNMMFRFMDVEKPDHLTVAFDEKAPTFRHEMYAAYKGTRKGMPDELHEQVPYTKEVLRAMNIPVISKPGLEADDLLGTMSRRAEAAGYDVTIISGDRDLLQLATDKIKIAIPKTKGGGTEVEEYYPADVMEHYMVTPTEFIDVKALQGDTSDNIPGIPMIGEKVAPKIIAKYHSLENAYQNAIDNEEEFSKEFGKAKCNKLKEFYEQGVMSKVLATIEVNADFEWNIDDAVIGDLFTPEAYELCKQFELKKLLSRFDVTEAAANVVDAEIEKTFTHIDSKAKLQEYISGIKSQYVGLYLAMEGQEIYGASISDGASAVWVRCGEAQEECQQLSLFGTDMGNDSASGAGSNSDITVHDLVELLQNLIESGSKIATANGKELVKILYPDIRNRKLDYNNLYDVAVADYLIHPLKKEYTAEDLGMDYLNMVVPSYTEIFAKKKFHEAVDMTEEMTRFAGYQSYVYASIVEKLQQELDKQHMLDLYNDIELPLVFTLADMELAGMAIDATALKAYGDKLAVRIAELEQEIYREAGEEFNINSPKQLGVILFEKMGIEGGKKTKTGYSTAVDVLEKLAATNPIVEDILEYRQLAKLKSTYADGLAKCIADDGRIHSSFQQTVTATGRISSTEPNLQNIPVRMELGKLIRKVFHPKTGYVFVDADYSQIELRVLAHMSGDENLISAFNNGQDIHRSTASLVFNVPFDEVTDLQRRSAKAVNFGIVYGISAFGLAQDIGVDRKEAQAYIDGYFVAYPQMKEYIDSLVASAHETGMVQTMYGRIRPIPELASSNFMQKQFGERVAKNSPIQGTAADIIKIAMVRVHDRLAREGLESRLLLQVHDELLIEAKESELEQVKKILQEEMVGAAQLSVDLEVDMHTGKDWYEAK